MAGLGVNIDHIATIRQARRTVEPDPVWAAVEAELGGADCITFHLRKDRRHINDRDAELLGRTVLCKLNMEMSMDQEIVDIAVKLKPDQASLVPESRQELTTEGGLDALAHAERLAEVTKILQDAGVVVSAFIDPITEQIQAAQRAGCDAIELHTGAYANACLSSARLELAAPAADQAQSDATQLSPVTADQALERIIAGVKTGLEAELIVHGGHGLTYNNITPIAAVKGFTEFNIGHSIIARAAFVGIRQATAEMKKLVK